MAYEITDPHLFDLTDLFMNGWLFRWGIREEQESTRVRMAYEITNPHSFNSVDPMNRQLPCCQMRERWDSMRVRMAYGVTNPHSFDLADPFMSGWLFCC